MVRPLRIEYEGAYYHVMSRGRGRGAVFHGDKYYDRFLSCIEQAHKRFGLEVHAYCLMGNHYHLLVRTPRANLARSMRHINGVYTQYYNFLRKTDGPLFRGRYKAINIEASSYLLEVSRYIHRNPIETKKPMVKRLDSYRWSSYPAYKNKVKHPDWLYTDSVLGEISSGEPIGAYSRFITQGIDEDTEAFYAKDQWPAVRGSKGFVEKAHLRSNAGGKNVRRERKVVGRQETLALVAERMECSKRDLLNAKRGRGANNTARAIAMKLCQENGSMKLSDIAKLFNVGSDSTVSRTISRFNELLLTDRKLEKVFYSIIQDLTP